MTADTVGGVWTYSIELARGLSQRNVEVALATMGGPLDASQQRDAGSISGLEVFESAFKLEWMEKPWEDVEAAGAWLLGIEKQMRPGIVHLNNYAHAALPWSAPAVVAGHSCVLSWWEAVKGCPAPGDWTRYASEVARGLTSADSVVCPTHEMLRALRRHYGITTGRVIPNARDPRLFGPARKEEIILSAGRLWDEAKNVRCLARIAPELPWPVFVAGDDRHPDGSSADLERVHYLGRIGTSELAVWYGRASIYSLPARYEPFGLSVLEAALSGCALVLGDIPSLRENWDGAACFVPPDDSDALASTLRQLIASAEIREEYQTRARVRAAEFTPARMGAAYFDLYRELAEARQNVCAL